MGFFAKIAEHMVSNGIRSMVTAMQRLSALNPALWGSRKADGLNLSHADLFHIAIEVECTKHDKLLHRQPDQSWRPISAILLENIDNLPMHIEQKNIELAAIPDSKRKVQCLLELTRTRRESYEFVKLMTTNAGHVEGIT
jgi:hypothetical protein